MVNFQNPGIGLSILRGKLRQKLSKEDLCYGIFRRTKRLFATTAVIIKQEMDEVESIKYFPMKLLFDFLEISPAPKNMKPVNRTVAIFSPTKAMMFV